MIELDPADGAVVPSRDYTEPNYLPDIHGFMTEGQEPMVASGLHLLVLMNTFSKLNSIKVLRGWQDMYIGGDCFWCYDPEKPHQLIAPDIFVVMNVQNAEEPRPRWNPSQENGQIPCFIVELISPSTFESDLIGKKDKYEKAGVQEYFIFDPSVETLQIPLMGYRLVNGVYVDLQPNGEGAFLSEVLNVWLSPQPLGLGMVDVHSGQPILSADEIAEAEKQRANAENRRANAEKRRANQEKLRADAAEKEILKLLEEKRLVEEMLQKLRKDMPPQS